MEMPCRSTQRAGAGKDLGDILSSSLLMQLFHLWGGGGCLVPSTPAWLEQAGCRHCLSVLFLHGCLTLQPAHQPIKTVCLHPPHHTLCPPSSPPCFTHTGTRAGIRWGLRSPALFQGSGTVGHTRCATAPTVIMRNGENPHYVLGQVSPCAGGFAGCPWRGMGLNNSLPAAPPHPRLQGGRWTDTCTSA